MTYYKYDALAVLMYQQRKGIKDCASAIGLCVPTLTSRMQGASDWRLPEIYALAEYLSIPQEQILNYFPKGD